MKFAGLFSKTPNHKRFQYTPRHYNPLEEERKERIEKIKRELHDTQQTVNNKNNQSIIKGSFQAARRRSAKKNEPSAALLRTGITLFIVILLWSFLQFGSIALYGFFLIVPVYVFLKFRK